MGKSTAVIAVAMAAAMTMATPAASWKLVTKWWNSNDIGGKIEREFAKPSREALASPACWSTGATLGQHKGSKDNCDKAVNK